jgi:hypothetical protein
MLMAARQALQRGGIDSVSTANVVFFYSTYVLPRTYLLQPAIITSRFSYFACSSFTLVRAVGNQVNGRWERDGERCVRTTLNHLSVSLCVFRAPLPARFDQW